MVVVVLEFVLLLEFEWLLSIVIIIVLGLVIKFTSFCLKPLQERGCG